MSVNLATRDKHIHGLFDDWFLPSIDELSAMYTELYLYNVGGLTDQYYWSSSEDNNTHAWDLSMSNNTQISNLKSDTYLIRPCRSFTSVSPSYSLREVGPAGGLIFYINGTTYYEATLSDIGTSIWSNVDDEMTGGTDTEIGSGPESTIVIISQEGHTNSAAKLCHDLVI